MSAPKTDTRKRVIQLIHIGKSKLGLDDKHYRLLLLETTGLMSAAQMSAAQLNAVLDEMKRRGFRPTGQWKGKPKPTGKTPLLRKVEAILADAGREWAYAHGLAKRMFGIERLEWLKPAQLHKLVAALQIDADRRASRVAKSGQTTPQKSV